MGVTFNWNKSVGKIAERFAGKEVQLFAANEAKKLMQPFVPMDTGMLANNADVYVENGAGVVHYVSPYAHRMYEGEGFDFSREAHPLATARWDKAMMQARGAEFTKAIQDYVKKGGD